jgi:hypothetical protein
VGAVEHASLAAGTQRDPSLSLAQYSQRTFSLVRYDEESRIATLALNRQAHLVNVPAGCEDEYAERVQRAEAAATAWANYKAAKKVY